jgi:hypothetical protein
MIIPSDVIGEYIIPEMALQLLHRTALSFQALIDKIKSSPYLIEQGKVLQ